MKLTFIEDEMVHDTGLSDTGVTYDDEFEDIVMIVIRVFIRKRIHYN